MPAKKAIAIDLGPRRLRAVQVSLGRGDRLDVERVISEPTPDSIDRGDADALGAWIRERLDAAKFARAPVTLAVGRNDVALKRLTLPTTETHEAPEMTRLAMQRELPFDPSNAVIDFLPLGETAVEDATSMDVLAVALPGEVLAFNERMAKVAGLKVDRVSLRCIGAVSLIASHHGDDNPPGLMIVDVANDAAEFTVIVDNVVHFARAADLPNTDDPAAIADAVSREARRTWMSFRMVGDENDVDRIAVVGDPTHARAVALAVGTELDLPAEVRDAHPCVDAGTVDMDGVWPLVGLLLAPRQGRPLLNFASPRKAPDFAARRRQRWLAAAGILIVIAAGGFAFAQISLAGLRDELAAQQQRYRPMLKDRVAYKRDVLRLQHLEYWEEANTDWLAHLARLAAVSPNPDQLVFDGWVGVLDFRGVEWSRKDKAWSAPRSVRITIDGEARDRAEAEAFRDALVGSDLYLARAAGPDAEGGQRLPFPFKLVLESGETAPTIVDADDDAGPKTTDADNALAARGGGSS